MKFMLQWVVKSYLLHRYGYGVLSGPKRRAIGMRILWSRNEKTEGIYDKIIPVLKYVKDNWKKRRGIHSAMGLKMQKGMQRLDCWEHFLIVKTVEILVKYWNRLYGSLWNLHHCFFKSKPVKQCKELLHCHRFFP